MAPAAKSPPPSDVPESITRSVWKNIAGLVVLILGLTIVLFSLGLPASFFAFTEVIDNYRILVFLCLLVCVLHIATELEASLSARVSLQNERQQRIVAASGILVFYYWCFVLGYFAFCIRSGPTLKLSSVGWYAAVCTLFAYSCIRFFQRCKSSDSTLQAGRQIASSRVASGVVWGTWALMTLCALGFVAVYGVNLPYQDEWDSIVPFYVGQQACTWQTLWQPFVNHHFPLPKLILIGLGEVTGHDFRAGMFCNVVLSSAVSGLLIATAKRIRGRVYWTDTLFAVLLLNWGHYKSMLWALMLVSVLTAVFSCIILCAIVRRSGLPSYGSIAWTGICLFGLLGSFGSGVVLAPVLAIWLATAGLCYWSAGKRTASALTLLLCVAVVGGAYLSYVGPREPNAVTYNLRQEAWSSLTFLNLSYSRLPPAPMASFLTFVFLAMTAVMLLRVSYRQPQDGSVHADCYCLLARSSRWDWGLLGRVVEISTPLATRCSPPPY
jgi:hypothetical protein